MIKNVSYHPLLTRSQSHIKESVSYHSYWPEVSSNKESVSYHSYWSEISSKREWVISLLLTRSQFQLIPHQYHPSIRSTVVTRCVHRYYYGPYPHFPIHWPDDRRVGCLSRRRINHSSCLHVTMGIPGEGWTNVLKLRLRFRLGRGSTPTPTPTRYRLGRLDFNDSVIVKNTLNIYFL